MNAPGPWQAHFQDFAGYNRANEGSYKAASDRNTAALRRDRGGFFKSVLG